MIIIGTPSNAIYLAEIEVVGTPDKNLRYQHLLNIFQAMKNSDLTIQTMKTILNENLTLI